MKHFKEIPHSSLPNSSIEQLDKPLVCGGTLSMEETWKNVVGFENKYKISNKGNVKALRSKTRRIAIIKKPHHDKNGYLTIVLYSKHKTLSISLHRLVAIHFISNPKGEKQVNHINGIKTDNRVENLEWVSCKENIRHAWINGLSNVSHNQLKSVSNMVIDIKTNITYKSITEASKAIGMKRRTLSHMLNGDHKNTTNLKLI